MDKDLTKISKFLSLILRHKPEEIGLQLDQNGWADVVELIEKSNGKLSYETLQKVVAQNDKKRFILSDDGTKIRANQGHSVAVDLQLKASLPPKVLFHGTATRFLDKILAEGLQKMNRHHVHLSSDTETAAKVGQRHGTLVILEIDAKAMIDAGHIFYLSENGVWLTDAVPARYLCVVEKAPKQ